MAHVTLANTCPGTRSPEIRALFTTRFVLSALRSYWASTSIALPTYSSHPDELRIRPWTF